VKRPGWDSFPKGKSPPIGGAITGAPEPIMFRFGIGGICGIRGPKDFPACRSSCIGLAMIYAIKGRLAKISL
jgi:hypothetical protein